MKIVKLPLTKHDVYVAKVDWWNTKASKEERRFILARTGEVDNSTMFMEIFAMCDADDLPPSIRLRIFDNIEYKIVGKNKVVIEP